MIPDDILRARPSEVLFWSGSGISIDAPTQAPDGQTLTYRVLQEAFTQELLVELRNVYEYMDIKSPSDYSKFKDLPRLESVLEVAIAEHGILILNELLRDLNDPPFNGNHSFFARHILTGGKHVTANFDLCIERAGGLRDTVEHFHGYLNSQDSGEGLGARLSRLEQGFDETKRSKLDSMLSSASLIAIVGYSGSDYFDVDPYWSRAAADGILTDKRILWIKHSDSSRQLFTGQDCSRRQLKQFSNHGIEVWEMVGPTRHALNEFGDRWGFPPIEPPPPWVGRSDLPPSLSIESRERAVTRYYAFAGLNVKVRERLVGNPLSLEEAGWAGEASWHAGRYQEAGKLFAQAHSGTSSTDEAIKRERLAAVKWIRGKLLSAHRDLVEALRIADQAALKPEVKLKIAETLGRVLVHMRRLPDTWLFSTSRKRNDIALYIENTSKDRAVHLGTHQNNQLKSVVKDLRGIRADVNSESSVEDFMEYEDLGSMLNYRHRQLRYSPSNAGQISKREFRRLADQFIRIGAEGDAARVPMLPGAELEFSIEEVWVGLKGVDFTKWHRLRLFLLWIIKRDLVWMLRFFLRE